MMVNDSGKIGIKVDRTTAVLKTEEGKECLGPSLRSLEVALTPALYPPQLSMNRGKL